MQETRAFVPVGFTFRPSDQQLIEYYLYRKVCGLPIPFVDAIVRDCDLYGSQEPWEIWESCGGPVFNYDGDLYIFTQLKKKTSKGSRICRKVGSGAWQGEDAANDIVSQGQEQVVIGSKKRFRYENKGSKDNGCWIMHEYTIHPSLLLGQTQVKNVVLCRIRKHLPSGKEKRSSGLAKKRKLEGVQSAEPDMFWIPQDQNQPQILCQSEAPTVVKVPEHRGSCNSNIMSESESSLIQREENGEIDNLMPVDGAAMVVPYQNSSNKYSEPEKFFNPQDQNQLQMICLSNQSEEIDQIVKMLEQEETSGTTEMITSDQILSKESDVDVDVALVVPYQKSSSQSSMSERFLIPQEHQQQIICENNVGFCQFEDTMMTVLNQKSSSNTDMMMMCEQILSYHPSDIKNHMFQKGEIYVTEVAMAVADQQEDSLAGISDENFSFPRNVFLETEYQVPMTVPYETSEALQQQQYCSDNDLLMHSDGDVFFSIDELLW